MKVVIIHGQSHKGSTYHLAYMLGEKLGGTLTEFFLPRDFGAFCVGCSRCFVDSEEKCPHFEKLAPITREIDRAAFRHGGNPADAAYWRKKVGWTESKRPWQQSGG